MNGLMISTVYNLKAQRHRLLYLLSAMMLSISNASAQTLPQESQLGQICYGDGDEQKISADTALWLARMIDGETYGHPTEVEANTMLWAIAQLSAVRKTKRNLTWKLDKLAQLYSQPINHKWTRSGRKCKRYYAKDFDGKIPRNCSKKKVKRRENNRSKPWNKLAPIARQTVLKFAKGDSINPAIGVQGWYASGLWYRRDKKNINTREHKLFHSKIDNNVFYTRTKSPATNNWDGFEVTIVAADSFCPMIIDLPSKKGSD